MDYRTFYDKSILEPMSDLLVTHLLLKYEAFTGLMITNEDKVIRYHAIRSKDIMEKMIEYYLNKKANIKWFYIRDLKHESDRRDKKGVLQH
jgi:hypothetical protein